MGHDLMGFWNQLVACAGHVDRVLNLAAHRAAELIGEGSVVSVLSADGRTLELAAMFHTDPQLDRVLHESLAGVSVDHRRGTRRDGGDEPGGGDAQRSRCGCDGGALRAPWWPVLELHPSAR